MDEVGKAFQRSKNLLEDALEGVLILNNENLIEFINKKGTDILGYPKEEVQGRRIFDFLTDIDQETLSFYLGSPNKNQVNIDKISFIKKNGDIIYLNFRLKPIIIRGNKTKKSIIYIEEKSVQIKNLKAELNKFQNIIEHIPETIYSSLPDDSSTTSFLSKKWEDWTGISVKKYYKDKDLWVKTIHPEDREETLRKYKQAVTNAEEFHLEYRVINKDTGNIVYIRDHGIPLKDSNDILIRYDGVMTNITDLVLTEKKLEKSEKKYRHLFENSPYTIGLLTLDGILVDVNPAANKLMSAHTIEDILGEPISKIWTLNEKNLPLISLFENAFQKVKKTQKPLELEFPIFQTKGGVKWVYGFVSTFNLNNRDLIQFIFKDITESKKIQKELKKSEKKFRHLFQNSPYAIGLFTFDGFLIDLNKAANKLMSVHAIDDIIGMHYKEFLSINKKNKPLINVYERGLRKLQKTREPLEFEFQINQTKGKTLWLHIYASVFSLEGQELIQFILNDITERKRSEIQLKEAQDKFRTISKQNFVAIVILQDNLFKYFNDEFLRVVGYSREEVNNWTDLEFLKVIHPEDREFVKKQALKKQAGDKDVTQNYEFRGIKKNGEIYWAEIFSKTVNYNGKPADLIITLDITERKKTRRELKESEIKYRTLFNNASDSILIHDLKAKILEANKTPINLLGYKRKELLNFSPEDYISQKYVSLIPRRIEEVRKKGQAIFESEHITKQGKTIPIEVNLKLIEYNGQPAILNFSRDISDRKKAEMKLEESEEKFRTIAEQSVIGIAIYQREKVEYLNESFAKILEEPYSKLTNSSYNKLLKLIHPDDKNKVLTYLRKKEGASEETFNFIFRIIKESNKTKWIEFNSKPISYQNERAILATIFDLTDQKKAEENLRKINKLKTELLSRTSHELKTPLVSIKGFTNLVLEMKKNELSADTIELIEEIKKGANRLELLIKDILDAAKLDFSKETLNKKEANLTKVIQSSIKSLTPLLKSRNLKLDVNIHEKLFLVFDKEKILQVLENLLSNAIKYTPSGGFIKIKTEIKENRCLVSVQDNGIGITPEEMPQLFTQFGKIEHYGSGLDVEIEGSGLGLFISKKIIDLHNGNIWAESEGRNKGSTFYFSLPVD